MAVSDLPAAGTIDAGEALSVRREIYGHGRRTPADMDLLFQTAQKSTDHDSVKWTNLFSEAVTDYVVHQNDPADYIPQEKADWLVAKLKQSGGITIIVGIRHADRSDEQRARRPAVAVGLRAW